MRSPRSVGRRPTSPRVARRRLADRARILEHAAARFAASGPKNVRLEEIAEAADVSRGTLYSHFESKEALTRALMRPVLTDAVRELANAERARGARERVAAVLEVYLVLWRRHAAALRLAHRLMEERDPSGDMELHLAFIGKVVAALEAAGRKGLLRAPTAELAGRTLARVAVPLLELYAPLPGGDALFEDAMLGLLLHERGP